jgi:hypothetical protein
MMSEEELKAIDDWRFNNRISTRSDAVRRLCQIGLLVGAELDGLSDHALKMSDAVGDLDEEAFAFWNLIADPANKGDKLNREAVLTILHGLLSRIDKIEEAAGNASSALVALYSGAVSLANHDSKEGRRLAAEAMENANTSIAEMQKLRSERRATMTVLNEIAYKTPADESDSNDEPRS